MAKFCFAIALCIALGINARAQLSEGVDSQNFPAGVKFLERNRAREGVITLPSGLQYEVLRRGYGVRPEPQDTVAINFRGTLADGTVFDTTYVRSSAATIAMVEARANGMC